MSTRRIVIDDVHQSGRFDADRRARLRMNHQIAQTATVGLITEYRGLDFLIHGWGEHGGETRIVWDRDFWNIKDKGNVHIKTGPWQRGTDERDSLDVPWALLEAEGTDWTLLRAGSHTPAHPDDERQARANEAVWSGLEPGFREVLGDLKPNQTSTSFDCNRQLTLARNRAMIEEPVKPLGLHLLVPPGATHRPNHRIDGFLVSWGKDDQDMLDWIDQYDHRGIHRRRKVRAA